MISCEKAHDTIINEDENIDSGNLIIGFNEDASLKSSFDLVNKFGLDITQVSGQHYISNLPNDRIDYVVKILETKQYLNNGRWRVVKNGNVYNNYRTGKITVLCTMVNMNEINQNDWFNIVEELKLIEQPSVKVFYLKVPIGYEISWRDKFRDQLIVKWADLNDIVEIDFFGP